MTVLRFWNGASKLRLQARWLSAGRRSYDLADTLKRRGRGERTRAGFAVRRARGISGYCVRQCKSRGFSSSTPQGILTMPPEVNY